jgi:hypothetical protein
VTGRQGRRRKKLLDDLKERKGYFHLKEEALDRTMWKARFGRGFGPVVRQKKKKKNTQILFGRKVLRMISSPTKERDGTWRIKRNYELDELIRH